MQIFGVKDMVTISIAAVGAVLGIINTVHSLDQRRVKLRVTPKSAHFVYGGELGEEMVCIEVINLSAFPVSVQEIGFTISGDVSKGKRAVITAPITMDRQPFPRRLESRQAVSGYFDLKSMPKNIGKAYVRTDCDEIAYGVSPALKNLRQQAGQ